MVRRLRVAAIAPTKRSSGAITGTAIIMSTRPDAWSRYARPRISSPSAIRPSQSSGSRKVSTSPVLATTRPSGSTTESSS